MTIIFDLDGTLLYTLEDLRDALNHTLKQFGYNEVSLDTTKKLVGNGIKNLILDASKDKQHIDLMFEEFKRYYEIHCIDKTLPYVGMVKLWRFLTPSAKRVYLCIWSRMRRPWILWKSAKRWKPK